jgi:hypothetical protein
MWRTVAMMMAEAMAMSASKRTLCLRRSILRMRFIAKLSPSCGRAMSDFNDIDL